MKAYKLSIGRGVIYQVEKMLNKAGIKGKIMYISDPNVDELYGECVKSQLEKIGTFRAEYVIYHSIAYADSLAKIIRDENICCIVGLGGGSVLDVCKYVSYITKRTLMLIPTTAANDGIASTIAVLKEENGKPKSIMCARASMILIDTELIYRAPVQLIKAGIGDILSNHMALLDWRLAYERGKDTINGYAYLMSKNAIDTIMQSKHKKICIEFVDDLVNAHVLSGFAMDFEKSSRPVSGSEHLFSHALDFYSDVKNLHGIQTGLGTIAILKMIGEEYSELLECFKRYEVDINPIHLGIDEDTFVFCMQHATQMRQGRYTYLHEIDLCEEGLRKVYKELVEEL